MGSGAARNSPAGCCQRRPLSSPAIWWTAICGAVRCRRTTCLGRSGCIPRSGTTNQAGHGLGCSPPSRCPESNLITTVHRTFLDPATAKKAPVKESRKLLGPTRGGVVQLSHHKDSHTLLVAEGIETAIAVSVLIGMLPVDLLPEGLGKLVIWAALSTSGMASLHVPSRVRHGAHRGR